MDKTKELKCDDGRIIKLSEINRYACLLIREKPKSFEIGAYFIISNNGIYYPVMRLLTKLGGIDGNQRINKYSGLVYKDLFYPAKTCINRSFFDDDYWVSDFEIIGHIETIKNIYTGDIGNKYKIPCK